MKERRKTTTGKISDAGRLQTFMGELNQWFGQHKGSKVMITFEIMPTQTTAALRAYYFNYVVPTFRNALWQSGQRMTKDAADYFMRSISPVMIDEVYDETSCRYVQSVRSIADISNAELVEHIETIKQIAAEEFSTYIEDPKY